MMTLLRILLDVHYFTCEGLNEAACHGTGDVVRRVHLRKLLGSSKLETRVATKQSNPAHT